MPELLNAVALVSEITGAQHGGRAHYWISNNAA
jgi:hydroxymethylglutaryl-CoA lyase